MAREIGEGERERERERDIYIYIERERDRDRDRDRDREKSTDKRLGGTPAQRREVQLIDLPSAFAERERAREAVRCTVLAGQREVILLLFAKLASIIIANLFAKLW